MAKGEHLHLKGESGEIVRGLVGVWGDWIGGWIGFGDGLV